MTNKPAHTTERTIEIELLALDLTSCKRCVETDRNLAEAIASVADLLREAGTEVLVKKHVVTTAEQAERLRFIASPTIRINGRDIALEFKESSCSDCDDLCDCDGDVDCRVWIWQGKEYREAPKGMIIDTLLKAYAAGPGDGNDFRLPENLRQFFARKLEQQRTAGTAADVHVSSDCCDRDTCCDSQAKADCCASTPAARLQAATQTSRSCC